MAVFTILKLCFYKGVATFVARLLAFTESKLNIASAVQIQAKVINLAKYNGSW